MECAACVQCSFCQVFQWKACFQQHLDECPQACKCPGCLQHVAKDGLTAHKSTCRGFIACRFCGIKVLRGEIAAHVAICPKAATCVGCQKRVAADGLVAHRMECAACVQCSFCQVFQWKACFQQHLDECPQACKCPGCLQHVAKDGLIAHKSTCRGFEACRFCDIRVLRGELAAHVAFCPEAATCGGCHHRVDKLILREHQHQCVDWQRLLADREHCMSLSKPTTRAAQTDGMKIVMYHGTSSSNAESIKRDCAFRPSVDGMLGRGVYLSKDINKAKAYGSVIFRCLVRVGRVKKIDRQGHPLQKTWQTSGYDTAWVPPRCGMNASGLEESCILDPKRIQILSTL